MKKRLIYTCLSIAFLSLQYSHALPLVAALQGNRITSLNHGEKLHEARLDLIHSAKQSIYFSTFSISNDIVGKELKNLLCKKAKKGIEVRVLIDHRQNKSYYETSRKLANCGAYVVNFRPGNRLYALHEKLLIVDGERAVVGGSGVSKKYKSHSFFSDTPYFQTTHNMKKGWYDKDYLIEGPTACSLHYQYQRNFVHIVKHWALYDHEMWWYGIDNYKQMMPKKFGFKNQNPCLSTAPKGHSKAVANIGNPYKKSSRPILENHIQAIESTIEKGNSGEFLLYAPYFVPHKKWVMAIEKALRAGIKVKVMTNSIESNDEGGRIGRVLFLAMYKRTKKLLDLGMEIHLWDKDSTLHRKGGLYGEWLYFGSDNLDVRAQEWQSESVVFTTDRDLVIEHESEYQRDLKKTIKLTKKFRKKNL